MTQSDVSSTDPTSNAADNKRSLMSLPPAYQAYLMC